MYSRQAAIFQFLNAPESGGDLASNCCPDSRQVAYRVHSPRIRTFGGYINALISNALYNFMTFFSNYVLKS
jgi:hypothetical protein